MQAGSVASSSFAVSTPTPVYPSYVSAPLAGVAAGHELPRWYGALDRFRLSGAKPLYHIADDTYTLTSARTGERYTILPVVDGTRVTYACSCPARGGVCQHRAGVAALPYEVARRDAAATAEHDTTGREGARRCTNCGVEPAQPSSDWCAPCAAVVPVMAAASGLRAVVICGHCGMDVLDPMHQVLCSYAE